MYLFIDSNRGDDGRDGLSPQTALHSIERALAVGGTRDLHLQLSGTFHVRGITIAAGEARARAELQQLVGAEAAEALDRRGWFGFRHPASGRAWALSQPPLSPSAAYQVPTGEWQHLCVVLRDVPRALPDADRTIALYRWIIHDEEAVLRTGVRRAGLRQEPWWGGGTTHDRAGTTILTPSHIYAAGSIPGRLSNYQAFLRQQLANNGLIGHSAQEHYVIRQLRLQDLGLPSWGRFPARGAATVQQDAYWLLYALAVHPRERAWVGAVRLGLGPGLMHVLADVDPALLYIPHGQYPSGRWAFSSIGYLEPAVLVGPGETFSWEIETGGEATLVLVGYVAHR